MVQFCMAYRHILEQHRLLATGTTGRLDGGKRRAEGYKVPAAATAVPSRSWRASPVRKWTCCSSSRDPISAKPSEPNEMNLLRICDVHNVPVATNIATAEVLIHGLEHGDLDWRTIINPQR